MSIYNAIQYSTIHRKSILYSEEKYSMSIYNAIQYSTIHRKSILYFIKNRI